MGKGDWGHTVLLSYSFLCYFFLFSDSPGCQETVKDFVILSWEVGTDDFESSLHSGRAEENNMWVNIVPGSRGSDTYSEPRILIGCERRQRRVNTQSEFI